MTTPKRVVRSALLPYLDAGGYRARIEGPPKGSSYGADLFREFGRDAARIRPVGEPEVFHQEMEFQGVLGADVSRAKGLAESGELLLSHLDGLRQSVQGVNIDEEVIALTQSQKAYQAAARVISVIDEMLDTLINRTAV